MHVYMRSLEGGHLARAVARRRQLRRARQYGTHSYCSYYYVAHRSYDVIPGAGFLVFSMTSVNVQPFELKSWLMWLFIGALG